MLVVDKPGGMTSHDVVDHVRKKLHTRKVGHAGTLDPDATGVLVVGVGAATRFLSYSQQSPKRYVATARLGVTTSTQDASGEVIATAPVAVTTDEVAAALARFTGEIEQIPPMVSAVKIGGERLYAKARRGEDVDRPARRVTIYDIELLEHSPDDDSLTFAVECSAGTYVRTIAHDLGAALGCGAHLVTLRRTHTGGFALGEAAPLEAIAETSLRPVADIVRVLPAITLGPEDALSVSHGRIVAAPPSLPDVAERAAVFEGDRLLGVCRVDAGRLHPERMVPA